MNIRSKISTILLLLPLAAPSLHGQELSPEAMQSLDEWRWGVLAYNDGLPAQSLLAMERAQSLNPSDPQIREWLGRSYWRSGLEDAALSTWNTLIQEEKASMFIQGKAENLYRRLSGEDEIPLDDTWIPFSSIIGGAEEGALFDRPASVRSLNDGTGSLIVSSYARGELIQFDANGSFIERFDGGVLGFDRPFDMLPLDDGRLLVSEFQADRIAVVSLKSFNRGLRIGAWGSSGRGDGELLGPQYMALSGDGNYVYISEWGNRRVSKWQLDGTFVLDFGDFSGPSGIVCYENRVYVADSLAGRIEVFDPSGNYLGSLVDRGLDEPEGLSIQGDSLLIADGARIHQVNLISGEMKITSDFGEGKHRITTVFPDENGNLALSDFDAGRIVLLTPLSTLYGGLNIRLDRVRADAFPDMVIDLTVKDYSGQPISGLNESNFRVSDADIAIDQPILDWSSSEDFSVSVVSIMDLSGRDQDVQAFFDGIDEVLTALKSGDEFALVTASDQPVLFEIPEGSGLEAVYNHLENPLLSREFHWDETLRLAAMQIVPDRKRKAVIAFVANRPNENSFDTYGLVESARLMANNGIVFYPVYINENARSGELDYIASETGGSPSFVFQAEGSRKIIETVRRSLIGRYTINWRTPRSSGFGRDFLPVSVEVVYLNKSGREESGTFAPLR